jgi:DNA (cytosine-5)-methyltransferase 1
MLDRPNAVPDRLLPSTAKNEALLAEDRSDPGQTDFASWWQSFLRGAPLPERPDDPPLSVVDLFCGAGGFGTGVALAARAFGRRARFDCIVDADAAAMGVYARSLPVRHTLEESVAALVDYRVRRSMGLARFAYEPEILHQSLARRLDVDLLIAGPPCQGHSNLNNHTRRDDPRNDLFVAAVATAVALRAQAVIVENVPSVTRSHGEVVRIAEELLNGAGYSVDHGVLRADALGGPQTRARFFMTAVRKDARRPLFPGELRRWAAARHRPPQTVRWAIGDLQGVVGHGLFDTAPSSTPENLRRIDWLFDNDAYDLDNAERPDCHREGTTYTAVYGRMHADRPAPTITTGIGTPGQGRFVHPALRRLITPHEAARLQGFPDGHAFVDAERPQSRKALSKWIGDAVPPLLGMSAALVALGASLGEVPATPWADHVAAA